MVWSLFGGVARLLLRRTCAFSLVVVKVLFFPLYRRRAFLCTATHKSKALISLESFSSNSLSFLVVQVAFEKKGRFFSNAHSLSDDIFLCFLPPTTHQHKEEIYIYTHNNAAFPRAIP